MSIGTTVVQRRNQVSSPRTPSENFERQITYYVFEGYAGQNNVQFASAIEHIILEVKEVHPGVNEIVLQSLIASCFASRELRPFIYYFSLQSIIDRSPMISTLFFTESQTSRRRSNTHFSCINLITKAFVEDENDINLEENILCAFFVCDGNAETTAVQLDSANFP